MFHSSQDYLEEMAQELEVLERFKIFENAELREVVRRRTAFERILNHNTPTQADFLRYAKFEMKVEKLLRSRVSLKVSGNKIARLTTHYIPRRIHFIFRRATQKFQGDFTLWMRWFDYCREIKADKQMQSAMLGALRLHSNSCALWSYIAAWELESRGDPTAARATLVQGLRENSTSRTLWIEYFRFELLYARLLSNHLEKHSKIAEVKLSYGALAVMHGAIAKIVFRAAVKARPSDMDLRILCAEILNTFENKNELLREIFDSIMNDFPDHMDTWQILTKEGFNVEKSYDTLTMKTSTHYSRILKLVDNTPLRTSRMLEMVGVSLHEMLLDSTEAGTTNIRDYILPKIQNLLIQSVCARKTTARLVEVLAGILVRNTNNLTLIRKGLSFMIETKEEHRTYCLEKRRLKASLAKEKLSL